MKVLTFRRDGAETLGAIAGDGHTSWCSPAAIVEAVERVEWATAADAAPPLTVSLADVEPLAPIPNLTALRDAMTFETHVIHSFRKGTLRRLAPSTPPGAGARWPGR